jgi:hypothetical protein
VITLLTSSYVLVLAVAGGVLWMFLEITLGKLWRARRERSAHVWPVSQARITKATAYAGKVDITLMLSYYYTVEAEPYPIPADYQKTFKSLQEAQRRADILYDQLVPVGVNPANCWKSILLESDVANIVQAAATNH